MTCLKEISRKDLSADQMLKELASDYEQIILCVRKGIVATYDLGDIGTSDMLTEALRDIEKQAWMLRAHL